MYDRLPSPGKENRVSITQDNGQVITGVLAYADEATQEGSSYTKGNVLPDDVCWLMDLDFDESEPDDAFRYLALMNATVYGGIAIRVISNGLPLSGITFSVTGTGNVTTDSQGYVFLRKPPGNYTATFTNTLDLVFSPASLQVAATAGKINAYTVEADEASITQQTFTSSTTINFSNRVSKFDVFCVGGGGSGGCVSYGYNLLADGTSIGAGCTGGAGGYTATAKNIQNIPNSPVSITVGSGGAKAVSEADGSTTGYNYILTGSVGNEGGETSVSFNGKKICSASGGKGGGYKLQTKSGNIYCIIQGSDGGSGSGGITGQQAIGDSGADGADGESATIGVNITPGGEGQGTTTRAFGENAGSPYSPAGGGVVAFYGNDFGDITTYGNAPAGAGDAVRSFVSPAGGIASGEDGKTPGAGGGAAMAVGSSSQPTQNLSSESGAGAPGLVIIRWRYK